MSEKIIHFGEFIRWHRVRANKTTEALGREVGLTARRLIAIEAMPTPDIQHTTMAALANAFSFDPETFNEKWQATPVPVTRRKPGPSTDEARRFNAACDRAGTTPIEAMRRLRSWIVEQDQQTQLAALTFIAPHRQPPEFTDAVDHLQDPAQVTKDRINQQATKRNPNPETRIPESNPKSE